ncbi:MAG: site-specific integrase [Rhodocyclaceae bacterium]|jgi:integrase|nr:site-specific integrase [Rhodocyclaceae bacterium]
MASIIQVGEKWRALIRRKGHPSYCQTFNTKAQAQAWARGIEADIDRGQTLAPKTVMGRVVLVSDLIDTYRKLRGKSRPIADTANEHYMLKTLERHLGTLDASRLSAADLVAYAEARKDEDGAGPYTVNMDISKLGTVMRLAGVHLKITLPDVVGQARPLLSHMHLIGGGGKRERRPEEDELARIVEWLELNRGRVYADAVRFAVMTAMRRGEIVRLEWGGLDAEKKLALIKNRKDPRKKAGNDQWVPLMNGAWELVQAQPNADARIFPIHEQTLSKYFKDACNALSIPDLHFHDLRHEGISRLFEQGFDIPRVALVSGHKSWNNLRRYAQLKPEDLHDGPGAPPAAVRPDTPQRP